MESLVDVAEALRTLRASAGLTQVQLAERASVPRVTLARMETVRHADMSLASLLRLLGAMGHELAFVRKAGHSRTLDDILAEQRGEGPR